MASNIVTVVQRIPDVSEFSIESMLSDLRELVEVESPSLDVEAITSSAKVLGGIIERLLGTPPALVESPAGPHVHWSGGGDPRVFIVGHHDTVFPIGALAERPFAIVDGRATGPGVFDMLGGIVQALHGISSLDDRSGVEIFISADEEVGSPHSRAAIEELALRCGAVLVLEPAADGGALKTGRKGCGTFDVTVRGRAAHAGLEPEKGVNALIEASHQVLVISGLGRADLGTTVTPTVASAGTADNVVPALAHIRVDVRVESANERQRVESAMASLRAVDPLATIEVTGNVNRPPMPEMASATLFPIAQIVLPGIGGVAVGGGSDGNFTAAIGVPTLDGLGAVGGGAHADHEYIEVASMPERARLIAGLVAHLTA